MDDLKITDIPVKELLLTPYTTWKWVCKVEGCQRHTHLKDFTSFPLLLFRNKEWINAYDQFFLCSDHFQPYRKDKASIILKDHYPLIDEVDKVIS